MKASAVVRLVAALLLTGTSAAAQDTPPRDPVDDAGVRFGPVGLTPVIAFRDIGRDNNVFNESTDPKTDFTATISPKLDVIATPGPLLFTFTTTTDYIYYQKYKSEGGTNVGASVRAEFALGPVRPFLSAGSGNTKERLNKEIDTRARHQDRNYETGVRVQVFEGLFASAAFRQKTTTFEEGETFRGESLPDALNERMQAIEGSVGVALTPLTSLSVVVTTQRDRFDLSPERDSDTLRVMPTVTFSPLAMLNGSAALGYRRFTTVQHVVPDYSGFVATLGLGATVAEKHRFETSFSRDVQYSYEETDVYYIETSVQGTWTWQVAGPIDLRVNGSRTRMHYPSPALTASTDDDAYYTYGAAVLWRLRPTLRVGLNADWWARESERDDDRAFDNRKIYASVTWGKQ
jgi:hypothetical protein